MKVQFDLGTRITFTQRAAVARKHTLNRAEPYWGLHEGYGKREMNPAVDDALGSFDPGERVNKAVFVWDTQGSGTVIGLVKRGIGESVAGHNYGEEFDPGYFAATEFRLLYAVKQGLPGVDYILVPVEAASLA